MNLLNYFNDNDTLIDCSISIIQEANKNGFNGFSGYCGQAAILINECLFNDTQKIFAVFNQCLQEKGYYIGHVACLIDLPDGSYFILDSDAEFKSIEDIEHWGVLDYEDIDYQKLFDKYKLEKTQKNFEIVSKLTLTKDFIFEHFNCSNIKEQKKILSESINKVLPLFYKNSCALKHKLL